MKTANEKVENVNEKVENVNEKVENVNEKVENVNEKVENVNEKVENVNEKVNAIDEKFNLIYSTIEKTIENTLKQNFISLRETFEIESIVKRNFLEVLKRYPQERDLQYFVNEIKNGKMNLDDFEKMLRNTPEFKNLELIQHACIYTKFGTKMYLNKKDNVISKDLSINLVWEPRESEILKNLVKKGMKLVDIGANIGYYTLLFSKWVGEDGIVFSFEPESENFELLKKNININRAENVRCYQKAISSKNESRLLFLAPENKGDHKIIDLHESEISEKTMVECVTLDSSEASKHKIDLIKMDIQGSEMLALNGMTETLEKNQDIIILTEIWPYGIEKSGYSPTEFFDKLKKYGFEISVIGEKEVIPIERDFKLLTNYQPTDYVNLLCKRKK